MPDNYTDGQVINFNHEVLQEPSSGEFAALIKVISSRYVSSNYPPESGFANKIVLEWTMLTTKENQFTRGYSTGIPFGTGAADITPDGKWLVARSESGGFKPNSDAVFLFRRAIASGFPEDLVTGDASIFDGHCFFIATTNNPGWQSSKRKPYPKQYHPEGWEAALAARGPSTPVVDHVSTLVAPTAIPASNSGASLISVTPEGFKLASSAIVEILATAGGTLLRNQVPAKVQEIAKAKKWTKEERQEVTLALWDPISFNTVLAANPSLQLVGDTISFK